MDMSPTLPPWKNKHKQTSKKQLSKQVLNVFLVCSSNKNMTINWVLLWKKRRGYYQVKGNAKKHGCKEEASYDDKSVQFIVKYFTYHLLTLYHKRYSEQSTQLLLFICHPNICWLLKKSLSSFIHFKQYYDSTCSVGFTLSLPHTHTHMVQDFKLTIKRNIF